MSGPAQLAPFMRYGSGSRLGGWLMSMLMAWLRVMRAMYVTGMA